MKVQQGVHQGVADNQCRHHPPLWINVTLLFTTHASIYQWMLGDGYQIVYPFLDGDVLNPNISNVVLSSDILQSAAASIPSSAVTPSHGSKAAASGREKGQIYLCAGALVPKRHATMREMICYYLCGRSKELIIGQLLSLLLVRQNSHLSQIYSHHIASFLAREEIRAGFEF